MNKDNNRIRTISFLLVLGLLTLHPLAAFAEETPIIAIETAKSAIENARKAGAERTAFDDLSAAKSWLYQAEKAYDAVKSILAKISTAKMRKAREEEVIYLATMAKIKGLTAEAKAKKYVTAAELKDTQKDLADYQSAVAVMKEKVKEAEQAKEVQARAEAERKQFEEAKRIAAELDARKRRELEESQRNVAQMEVQKRKELEDAQRKTADLEALKERELQESQLKDAKRAADREKEAAEAKLKDAQLTLQRTKEAMEMKAKEESLTAEKQKFAVMQSKLQAMEQEKAMLTAAGNIQNVTVKMSDKKIAMTILVINLFNPANDLKATGKEILNNVGKFLKAYPDSKAIVQGHTDSQGKPAVNQAISEKRAKKVREYLVADQNISPGRVTAEGLGSMQPAATNATEAGRALNRRVALIILTGEP